MTYMPREKAPDPAPSYLSMSVAQKKQNEDDLRKRSAPSVAIIGSVDRWRPTFKASDHTPLCGRKGVEYAKP